MSDTKIEISILYELVRYPDELWAMVVWAMSSCAASCNLTLMGKIVTY